MVAKLISISILGAVAKTLLASNETNANGSQRETHTNRFAIRINQFVLVFKDCKALEITKTEQSRANEK